MVERSSENRPGIGSPEYFGSFIKALRGCYDQTPEQFSRRMGIEVHQLGHIEQGIHLIPKENTLRTWMSGMNLPDDERGDMLISAGFMPDVAGPINEQGARLAVEALVRGSSLGVRDWLSVGVAILEDKLRGRK